MVIEIPDKILLKKDAEPEVRFAIAVVLFNNGWLTLESAVRLSGRRDQLLKKRSLEKMLSICRSRVVEMLAGLRKMMILSWQN